MDSKPLCVLHAPFFKKNKKQKQLSSNTSKDDLLRAARRGRKSSTLRFLSCVCLLRPSPWELLGVDEERIVSPYAPPTPRHFPAPPLAALHVAPSSSASSPSTLSCLGSASLLPVGSHRPHKLIRHLLESSADSESGGGVNGEHFLSGTMITILTRALIRARAGVKPRHCQAGSHTRNDGGQACLQIAQRL